MRRPVGRLPQWTIGSKPRALARSADGRFAQTSVRSQIDRASSGAGRLVEKHAVDPFDL
jgi:hypothetical protein